MINYYSFSGFGLLISSSISFSLSSGIVRTKPCISYTGFLFFFSFLGLSFFMSLLFAIIFKLLHIAKVIQFYRFC